VIFRQAVASTPLPEFQMRMLAEETGGRAFLATPDHELGATYKQIAEELGQQYWLAYSPRGGSGGFKRVSIKVVSHPTHRARTRSGYFARPGRVATTAPTATTARDARCPPEAHSQRCE
jgi:hypothetical protein